MDRIETLVKPMTWPDFSVQMRYKASLGMIKPILEPEVLRGGILKEIDNYKGANCD